MQSFQDWLKRGEPKQKMRSRIRQASPKRQQEMRIYSQRRKEFLRAHPFCQAQFIIWPVKGDEIRKMEPATEVHHRAGRIGHKLLDETDWVAISRKAHWFIHRNPSQARKLGLLL